MRQKIHLDPPQKSDIQPELLDDETVIQFDCHPGVSCFNVCCQNADVMLAPFDIIRLKKRLGITSGEFLKRHTVPFEMDGKGLTGVKLKTDEKKHCLFLTDAGCGVYEDRPSACRYYPLGLMARKIKEEKQARFHSAMIKEDYCKGHEEAKTLSIKTYKEEQKIPEFDRHNEDWMKILLKKSSAGPAIGHVPELTLQLFFMCSFDIDRFRQFVNSKNFRKTYKISDALFQKLQNDDIELLHFGYRLMNQVFFAENTIELFKNAAKKRAEERKEIIEIRKKNERKRWEKEQEKRKREAEKS